MLSGTIEALYIYHAQTHDIILTHTYRGRPCSPRALLAAYLARPAPRPAVSYFPSLSPPTVLFVQRHTDLLLCVPASTDTEPLLALEFLHRLVEILESFLGGPLLASKIESRYDVVAQLLAEVCDAGLVSCTEPDALRDVVTVEGWMDRFLGGVGLTGTVPSSSAHHTPLALRPPANAGPAIPWRRPNVKHISNELYVDLVETLHVTLAPSGRPLAAVAHGSVLFHAKISGVPDLLLTLNVPAGTHAVARTLEFPTFHPCVRLARWRERPGELSFVPPDGKFLLAGYEVNLLPSPDTSTHTAKALHLPALVEVVTGLGPHGADFEVRLTLSPPAAGSSGGSSSSLGSSGMTSSSTLGSSHARAASSGRSTPNFFASLGGGSGSSSGLGGSGTVTAPALTDVEVHVPIPSAVRAVTDLRASRGEAAFTPADHEVSWRLSAKEAAAPGIATLRCTVVGPWSADAAATGPPLDAAAGEYVAEEELAYQASTHGSGAKSSTRAERQQQQQQQQQPQQKTAAAAAAAAALMPRAASLSFAVQGWVPSGVRVGSLTIDAQRSRGLGEGVRPIKGAKYLAVSRRGVETRC